jgi:Uma2 family endonuclease
MSVLINDEKIASELLAHRRAIGADRFDEVWEGTYMMVPAPNNEHQELASELTAILRTVVDWKQLGRTLAGANVSDRREKWRDNYRVPDILVFLNDTSAVDCETHWYGGPDFAIEIVSAGDRTLDKLDFFAAVGTRELLVIDRQPWQLTLYRATPAGKLSPVAVSSFTQEATITSAVIPIQFRLARDSTAIELALPDGQLIRSIPITANR